MVKRRRRRTKLTQRVQTPVDEDSELVTGSLTVPPAPSTSHRGRGRPGSRGPRGTGRGTRLGSRGRGKAATPATAEAGKFTLFYLFMGGGALNSA